MKTTTLHYSLSRRAILPCFLIVLLNLLGFTGLVGQTILFEQDFETSTPGAQPIGDWTFSPSSNTATNGAVVLDATTTPANVLSGQSLYVYDLNGDGTSGESTQIRQDLAGGNVSAARAAFTFQRMYATDASDGDTRVHFTIGQAGLSMNNSDFRLFEFRMYNNGDLRVEYSNDGAGGDRGSEVVGTYDTVNPNEAVFFINSHGSASVSYDDGTLSGSLAPNTMDVYVNGAFLGSFLTLKTPDPTNAPQIDFWASDADLGQIAFYQDSKRQGGIVIDDIVVEAIPVVEPLPIIFEQDFESSTPGEQPIGDWTFSPSTNTATNGVVVVDATTDPVNPLSGQSAYVYDLNGDGTSGEGTHMRQDFAGGNVSAARAAFTFQRMYATDASDGDTRVHFTIGQAGLSMNNSDFRLFEFRMYNNGDLRVEYSNDGAGGDRGSEVVGTYDTANPNEAVFFINSHGLENVEYNDGTLSGTLPPNTMDVWVNGAFIGSFLTLKTPDPTNAPQIDFWASDADLGQIAFYQDSKRQGGIVIDDIVVQELAVGGDGPVELQVFIDNFDFEDETLGEQPVMPFPTSFTPSSNTAGNGFEVIDATTDPANPMGTGKALYAYDLVGDLSSGESTHMRFDFAPTNTDNVRVDLDFQRAYSVAAEDEDTRMHIGLAPAGTSTNNSDFRPFEIRILNNGSLVVNYNPTGALLDGRESEVVAQYNTTGANRLTFFANGNNGTGLEYDDEVLGQGVVPPNTMVLFLNEVKVGEYGFINTPDPGNAPHIAFFETSDDFGRFGIYQDSKRQGGVIFDNLSMREFAILGPPAAPSGLTATATGPTTIELAWTDNAADETGFIIEQLDGSSWVEVGTASADATSFEVTGLDPETEYTFRVLATNGTPSDPSNESSATTEVQLLPMVVVEPEGFLLPSGSSGELFVEATGPGTLLYQWYEGASGDTSTPVSGATDAVLVTPVLTASTSYWVRVTNDNGSADSVSATIEVFEPREIRVVSIAQLDSILPAALPGDTYVLDAGTYVDTGIRFVGEGTETAPITLKAEVPGEVILTGDSYLELGGDWLIVEGLLFTDGWNQSRDQVISFRASGASQASNSRVTQCAIIDYSPADSTIDRDWVGMYGHNNRFDHNYLSGHSNKGVTLVVWRNPGVLDNHRIDFNHFANRASGGGENGWETLRIGTSSDSLSASQTVVEFNLFEACNGEIEIISNKSGENVYRYNTFLRCEGMLTLRHGNDCLVEGNIFLGRGVANSGGIRVIGENHTVINNYIEGTTGRDGAAITVYAGVPNSPLNEYFAAHNAWIGNNTIIDVEGTHIQVGAGYGSRERTVLPTGVVITNNLFAQAMTSGATTTGPALGGEAVADPVYAGNIASNVTEGISDPGITSASVDFSEGFFGLLRPDAGSPAIDSADAAYEVALDLDGQTRAGLQDVGADELSDLPGLNEGGALVPSEVGPDWLIVANLELPWYGEGVNIGDEVISPWFGTFTVTANDWLKHDTMGYINVGSVDSESSMWIWSQPLDGWIWSAKPIYPIVYDAASAKWIFYLVIDGSDGYMYDIESETWIEFP